VKKRVGTKPADLSLRNKSGRNLSNSHKKSVEASLEYGLESKKNGRASCDNLHEKMRTPDLSRGVPKLKE